MFEPRSRRTTRRLITLAVAAALSTVTACGTETADTASSRPTATAESPSSTALTCGGLGIDNTAPIHYRTEAVIAAPLRTIWELQTDVTRWPTWQQPVTSMKRLDEGPLRAGSPFQWTTPVPATRTTPATTLVITSTIQQVEPNRCLRWTGPAAGDGLSIENGVHVWTFTEVDGGVLVRTEENWRGAQVEADVPTSTTFLGMGLDAWLQNLKAAAEAPR